MLYYTILYYTLYTIHHILYTIYYILYTILYTIHYIPYTVYYILYTVYYTIYYNIYYTCDKKRRLNDVPNTSGKCTFRMHVGYNNYYTYNYDFYMNAIRSAYSNRIATSSSTTWIPSCCDRPTTKVSSCVCVPDGLVVHPHTTSNYARTNPLPQRWFTPTQGDIATQPPQITHTSNTGYDSASRVQNNMASASALQCNTQTPKPPQVGCCLHICDPSRQLLHYRFPARAAIHVLTPIAKLVINRIVAII